VIQRAGAHAHQDFIGTDLRLWNIFVFENFRTAMLVDSNGFHLDFSCYPSPEHSLTCKRYLARTHIEESA
jgi:hypothetical protein